MGDPTYLTHAVEASTYETNTIEISDPDEFCLSEKIINNDNMLMTQTRHTYTIETSDEFHIFIRYYGDLV